MTKFFSSLIIAIMIFGALLPGTKVLASPVLAQSSNVPAGTSSNTNTSTNTGSGSQTSGTQKPIVKYKIPITEDFSQLFNRVVSILLAIAASLAIIYIIIGGFQLAFSQGKAEAAATAKKTITWAIVGLIVALMAFAIVRIVDSLIFP